MVTFLLPPLYHSTGLSRIMVNRNTTGRVQPGLEPNPCLRGNFELGFRYGIGNIENFTLVVGRVNASETGSSVISAYRVNPSWICMIDPEAGVRERCVWVGVLSIDVNTV